MTVSGTISTTTFDIARVIEAAFRRCRVPSQEVTGEMVQIAKDALYLHLSAKPTNGMQLWALDKQLIGLVQGQAAYACPAGTIDLADKNALMLRTMSYFTGTNSVRLGGTQVYFGSGVTNQITTAGLVFTTGGTFALIFETSNDGVTWTQAAAPASATYVAGQPYWFDMDPSLFASYFSVRDAGGQVLSISNLSTCGAPYDRPIERQSNYDYLAQAMKFTQGRPVVGWIDRQRDAPVIRLWPAPDAGSAQAILVLWRKRHIMDIASLTQTLDVPQRQYDAIVARLAAKVAIECPIVNPQMIPLTKQLADEAETLAIAEDSDDTPIRILPRIAGYT